METDDEPNRDDRDQEAPGDGHEPGDHHRPVPKRTESESNNDLSGERSSYPGRVDWHRIEPPSSDCGECDGRSGQAEPDGHS